MRRPSTILLALAPWMAVAAASANDGIAEREAGGLVFRTTSEIDMLSEDLYVSRERIQVRYRFRNRTPRDARVTVAFALPDHDLREDFYGDTAYPRDFRTTVDGQPIAMQVEHRAFWQGVEHTALLNRLGVPIMSVDGTLDPIVAALSALPAADQQRLIDIGLVEPFDLPQEGRSLSPVWTVRESWYREQVFPVGREVVVEHSYRPGAGGTHSTGLAGAGRGDGDHNRRMIERYCIDDAFLAAVDRIAARDGAAYLGETYVSYILTTGAGWASPIGEFRLVVDKERPENLVSFCGEGVRCISPTKFEMRRSNWRPDRDLHVLILHPRPRE
ncbi:MAG: DUF4424 domain-containing protein [Pseudomonadota bacterium]|nr:DUF4424 domain-containing protein [Pseudomonadota bacterium]